MEQHLEVASSGKVDHTEHAAEIRGEIHFIDRLLRGEFDRQAQEALGLHPDQPKAGVEPHMPLEPLPDITHPEPEKG